MLHTICNSDLTVVVADKGAELQSIKGTDGLEYLWQGDSKYWTDRALNIFPYVARLTQNKYYLDGHQYNMNIHGIAPYSDFVVVEKSKTRLVMELGSDEETTKRFPRNFLFRIIYVLQKNTLLITYEVENRDKMPMYFGLGGHPGFNVPIVDGLKFKDYQLHFDSSCEPVRIGFNDECFLNGKNTPFPLESHCILPLRHDLFNNDAIVLKNMSKKVTLEADEGPSITVSFPKMTYLGIWHCPNTDAPYICIEPWCSLPSTEGEIAVFEEQKDLITLLPQKTYINEWTITINEKATAN